MGKNRFRCKFKQNKQKKKHNTNECTWCRETNSERITCTHLVCDKIHCTLVAGCATDNEFSFRTQPLTLTHVIIMQAHFWHSCLPLESFRCPPFSSPARILCTVLLSSVFEHFRFPLFFFVFAGLMLRRANFNFANGSLALPAEQQRRKSSKENIVMKW